MCERENKKRSRGKGRKKKASDLERRVIKHTEERLFSRKIKGGEKRKNQGGKERGVSRVGEKVRCKS